VYYATVTRNNTQKTVLKLTYFTAVIDGVFCLDARLIYRRETLSVVTIERSEIMGTYNTPDTVVKDKKTK